MTKPAYSRRSLSLTVACPPRADRGQHPVPWSSNQPTGFDGHVREEVQVSDLVLFQPLLYCRVVASEFDASVGEPAVLGAGAPSM
jgi:hypothetical protein